MRDTIIETSPTAVRTWRWCPRKYYYTRRLRLVPKKVYMPFAIGTAIHRGVQSIIQGEDLSVATEKAVCAFDEETKDFLTMCSHEEMEDTCFQRTWIVPLVTGYSFRWAPEMMSNWQVKHVEYELAPVTIPIMYFSGGTLPRCKLSGHIDYLLYQPENGWLWIGEIKTTGEPFTHLIGGAHINDQILSYLYLLDPYEPSTQVPVKGVMLDLIHKPSIRLKQKENVVQYERRLFQDVHDRPEFYFHREKVVKDAVDLKAWEEDFKVTAGMIVACGNEMHMFPRYTDRCTLRSKCAYLPLCTSIGEMYQNYLKTLYVVEERPEKEEKE